MKFIKYFLLAGITSVAATSCTDLDVTVDSQLTSYPDNEIAVEAKLADCYYAFRGGIGLGYLLNIASASDEMFAVTYDGGWWDGGYRVYANFHNWNPEGGPADQWSDLASGVTKCTQVLNEIEETDANRTQLAGVRLMRAYYIFMLMDLYGDVPCMPLQQAKEEAGEIEASDAILRLPRAEVAQWIETEVLSIMDALDPASDDNTYGKPNKWMAKALLAKLYVNWAVYTCGDVSTYEPTMTNEKLSACVAVCDDIINSGLFEVGDGYRKKFFPDNGSQIKDFIYAMPFDWDTETMDYARYLTYRWYAKLSQGFYGWNLPSGNMGGFYIFTNEFASLFNLEGDERNEIVLRDQIYAMDPNTYDWTDQAVYTDEGNPLIFKPAPSDLSGFTGSGGQVRLDVGSDHNAYMIGYKSCKWPCSYDDYVSHSRHGRNDVPVFRYADILLTKAECILRGASATLGDTPASLLNQVRRCSSAPEVTANPTLQELLDERGREFVNENWRRNDLIRFGNYEDDWGFKNIVNPAAKTNKYLRVFPVPNSILRLNTNWTQNPGEENLPLEIAGL